MTFCCNWCYVSLHVQYLQLYCIMVNVSCIQNGYEAKSNIIIKTSEIIPVKKLGSHDYPQTPVSIQLT